MYCQSNLIISTNSETKTFKNITLKNKTISNRGGSRVPAKSKAEVLATIVTSRTLLTKVGMSSIIYFAELLDTPSKIKLHKNITCNITKQKKERNQRKPDFNFFLCKIHHSANQNIFWFYNHHYIYILFYHC